MSTQHVAKLRLSCDGICLLGQSLTGLGRLGQLKLSWAWIPHPETFFVKKQTYSALFAVWFVQTSEPPSLLVALPLCVLSRMMLVLSLAPSLGKRQRWLILVHWSISATTETDFQGGIVDNLSCCPPLEDQRRAMTGRAAILDATERLKEVAVQYIHGDPTLCHARHGCWR